MYFISIALLIIIAFLLAVKAFMKQAKFGKTPGAQRLEQIKNSPHFKNGKFENLSYTPDLAEGVTYWSVLKQFFFERSKRGKPANPLPSVKINLHTLSKTDNILVWFGHSSYFLQIDGKTFLVDPVFSGAASPIKFTTKSFKGADVYKAADMPFIDFLIISHDHWDHLDHDTIIRLKQQTGKIICSLGVGQHFEHWGFTAEKITEMQWHEKVVLENGFTIHSTPARHFSGRGFKRNQSMWQSYVLQTPTLNIFIGGDSGYDTHFEQIGAAFGPFDLAILECGQYNTSWKYIHSMPAEIIQEAIALKANRVMPVHWAKFQLALHAWDEPINTFSKLAEENNITIVTPMIGEIVELNNEHQQFSQWWKHIG